MIYKIKNKKGFSVVEIIIYLAIFTMISLLVINSLIVVMSSFATTRTNIILLEAGTNSMERMSRDIRQSKSVDLVNSNLSQGILQLNSTDLSGNPIVIKFSSQGSKLNLYQDGVLSGNLLGQNVALNSLSFRLINTTQSEALKIKMTIHNISNKTIKTVNFYDTIVLRGSYK